MESKFVELEDLKEEKIKFFKPTTGIAYQELKNSIKKRGMLTSLLISKDYEILDGWTRYLIASELNLKEVPCEIIEEDLSENEKILRGLESNRRRRQLTENEQILADREIIKTARQIIINRRAAKVSDELKAPKKEKQGLLVPPEPKVEKKMGRPISEEPSEREILNEAHVSRRRVRRVKEYDKALEEEPDLAGLGVKTTIRKAKERKIPDEDKQRIKFCESLAKDIHNYVKVIEEPNTLKEIKVLLSHFTTSERLKRKIMKLIAIEKILPVDSNNPIEILIMTYKQIAGFAIKDRIWNKIHYPRHIKDAKLLLEAADDDITLAKEAIKNIGTYFQVQEISWSLKAIVKNLPAYQSNPDSFAKKTNQAMLKNISKWQEEDRKEDKAFLEKTFDEKVKDGFEISKSGENEGK